MKATASAETRVKRLIGRHVPTTRERGIILRMLGLARKPEKETHSNERQRARCLDTAGDLALAILGTTPPSDRALAGWNPPNRGATARQLTGWDSL